jgi:hypothetical protein
MLSEKLLMTGLIIGLGAVAALVVRGVIMKGVAA